MCSVVHDASQVIGDVQVLNIVPRVLVEVVFHSRLNVLPVDTDVFVSIEATLLMPEADYVHQLMLTDSHVHATDTEGHELHATTTTNLGRTAVTGIDVDKVVIRGSFRLEADAGFVCVSFDGSGKNGSVPSRVFAGQDVRDPAVGPECALVPDSVSAGLKQKVSVQQWGTGVGIYR